MLTLLLLLILCSASLQKSLNSQDENDLEHEVPENRATSRRLLESSRSSRQIREAEGKVDHGKLKWKEMRRSSNLPDGAVFTYNKNAKCKEYVCRYSCYSGFYRPSLDSQCHVSLDDRELRAVVFDILVNEDDFESLQWKDASYGSVPQNSVRACDSEEIYVGKNHYGLGKVDPKQQRFYIGWKGFQYWYRYYQVLTMDKDVESNFMTDIRYNTDDARIVSHPPETMNTSAVINYECNPVSKSATLTKTIQEEKMWDLSSSLTLGAKTEFSVGIPSITKGKVEVGAPTTFQASGGNSTTEIITHTVTVSHLVPPNHSCTVRMLGHQYTTDIPFTARFRRTFRNKKTAWTSISGKYNSVQVGEVHAVVDRCTPVDNPSTCP